MRIELQPKEYAKLCNIQIGIPFFADFGSSSEDDFQCNVVLLDNGTIITEQYYNVTSYADQILQYRVTQNAK